VRPDERKESIMWRKYLPKIGACLLAAAPLCVAVSSPAMASQECGTLPVSGSNVYITNYSNYLTDPYGGGNGTAVKFDTNVTNPSSLWSVVGYGPVSQVNPFKGNNNFNKMYGCDEVVSFENNQNDSYSLGTEDTSAVMRPNADGNYFVAVPEGSNYKLISVYATNNADGGGGLIAYCLTYRAPGQQAVYVSCDSSGQIMDLE
jgi:hypothetical protein